MYPHRPLEFFCVFLGMKQAKSGVEWICKFKFGILSYTQYKLKPKEILWFGAIGQECRVNGKSEKLKILSVEV